MFKDCEIDPDWAQEIEDVEPLNPKNKKELSLSAYVVEHHDYEDDIVEAIPHHMQEIDTKPQKLNYDIPRSNELFTDKVHTLESFSAARVSISSDVFKKLKKGLVPVERKLDLHGFKEEEAWQGLNDFLLEVYSQGLRCVLIVHGKGKGYGDKGDMGIIKANICAWLENSGLVLAYHTAQGKHGGSGAVYVLIRRNKNERGFE